MQTIFNKQRLVFLLCALWALSAAAWAKPRVSVHPLSVEQGRRGERWNDLFMREVAKQNIRMTPEVEVEAFLETHGGSCKNETRCLRDLGYATRAHYILAGSMLRTENIYTVHARIVMVNGEEVKRVSLDMERVSKVSEEANAVAVYDKLFEELKLESLPRSPADVSLEPPEKEIVKETVIETETVVRMPDGRLQSKEELRAELNRSMSPVRKSAYVMWGVAGASALTGTTFALMANHNSKKFRNAYNHNSGPDNLLLEEASTFRKKVSTQKTASIVAFSVAAASAIAGTTLFFISPERYLVGLAPTEGGAVLSIQGVFPYTK